MIEQKQNNVYSFNGFFALAPGGADTVTMDINIPRNEFRVKSVFWDYSITDEVGNNEIPIYNTGLTWVTLTLGTTIAAIPLIAKTFVNIVVPAGGGSLNGVNVVMNKPGQYFYDHWLIIETLPITISAENFSLLDTLTYYLNLAIEIEPLSYLK